jgi:hypothetical protein
LAKNKVVLDRKTRRSIQNMMRAEHARSQKASGSAVADRASAVWATTSIKSASVNGKATQAVKSAPLIDGELYVSSRYLWGNMWFHNRVAQHFGALPENIPVNRTGGESQLAFFSAEDRHTYEEWMNDYLTKFSGHTTSRVPPPVDGIYPHTVRVKFGGGGVDITSTTISVSDDSDRLIQQWTWILDNCLGEVRQTGDFWFFAEEGDATLFKMAF